MKKRMIVSLASLALLAGLAQAQAQAQAPRAQANACPANAPALQAGALKKPGLELPVSARYCYSDKSGSYALVLAEKQDRPFTQEKLSSAIQAVLYKLDAGNGSPVEQWRVRDFAGKDDAGIDFRPELVEFADIDGDGLIEPILVYRFFAQDGGAPDTDEFSGGIKIVTFHRGSKVTIHALTGELDDERSTTANANYFALPKPAQRYLVKKMAAMYDARQFGFDNSYAFQPRKEGAR